MLSVAVINYKNPPLLRLCLKSLLRNISKDFKCDITVIDIASSIETRNVVREEFKGINLISHPDNIGYTKGVNSAITSTKGDYILILNPDVIITPGSIETAYSFLKNNESVGLLGPELLNFDSSHQDSCFRYYSPLTVLARRSILGKLKFFKDINDNFLMHDVDLTKTQNADWIMGSAYMISRKAILKVGLLDERFFLYMSDVDWARRFWENGYRVVYYPESKMYHYHRRGSKNRFDVLTALFRKEPRTHLLDALKYFNKYGYRKLESKILSK